MMGEAKRYTFYTRADSNKEAIDKAFAFTRYDAALYFAQRKCMDLKSFLKVYSVSR